MTNAEIANQLFVDEDEINPVSNCCSAAVSDPSGEGIEGRCTDCGEMCSIVEETQHEQNKTFGEKLDEILLYVHNSGRMADRKLAETKPEDILPWLNVDQAKQAITSLIKELVAEAKPEVKAHPLGPVTLADCQRGLDHYEANLLKALEEV